MHDALDRVQRILIGLAMVQHSKKAAKAPAAAARVRMKFRVQSVMASATNAYAGPEGNRSYLEVPQSKVWLVPVKDAPENAALSVGGLTGEIELRGLTSEAAKAFEVNGVVTVEISR